MEQKFRKNSIAFTLLRAVFLGLIISAVMILIISALMLKVGLSETATSVLVIVTYILSNIVAGLFMGKGMEKRRFLWGMLSGATYFVLLLLVALLFTDAKDLNIASAIRTLMICLFSGMFGGMVS